MDISSSNQIIIERALEVAARSVSTEDGKDFRQLLQKIRETKIDESALDGIRNDYTDNI